MGHKKSNDKLRTKNQLDKLKWETAKEMALTDDNSLKAENTKTENKARKIVKLNEEKLAQEGDRKAQLNLKR
ncbi:MAG: small acid-soluble spore protein [Clostridia bacterium]|nr:small acid-soluble spore protein [Clostridia bacterium]